MELRIFLERLSVDSLVNLAIQNRNVVVGGTSAGMAILGGYYFSAQNGTVTSAEALTNPYNTRVTVDSTKLHQCSFPEQSSSPIRTLTAPTERAGLPFLWLGFLTTMA
jgi:hypothetical protein